VMGSCWAPWGGDADYYAFVGSTQPWGVQPMVRIANLDHVAESSEACRNVPCYALLCPAMPCYAMLC